MVIVDVHTPKRHQLVKRYAPFSGETIEISMHQLAVKRVVTGWNRRMSREHARLSDQRKGRFEIESVLVAKRSKSLQAQKRRMPFVHVANFGENADGSKRSRHFGRPERI